MISVRQDRSTKALNYTSFNIELNSGSNQEDLVDPATVIKEKCAETDCTKYKERLDECNNRVRIVNQLD